MANKAGIAVSSSRFAVLKIEDDEEDERKPVAKPAQQQNSANAAKKKNKKKKDHKESEQLKSLAFGKGGGGGAGKHPKNGGSGDGGEQKQKKNWDQWREHDAELVEEQYKDDLEKALLMSRLEDEQKRQEAAKQRERIAQGLEAPPTREGKKKKRQKDKPQPMSLGQFKQLPPEKPVGSDSEDEKPASPPPIYTRVPPTQQEPRFFNSVEDDAAHILRQEKIQEEYRKQYATDSAVVAKLKNDLDKKDQELLEMVTKFEALETELKQVKKRNKQLCVILAQGEMKDKAQVLLQVDELTAVKDELTEQVTTLTAELEREKSKNHAMKAEIDKLKGSKHGK